MAIGDYNYDEYLNDPERYRDYLRSDRYSDILPSNTAFDPAVAGDYSNTQALTLEILNRSKQASDNYGLDNVDSEEDLEKIIREGGSDTVELSEFKGIERNEANNFGYIDKPGILNLASFLPGVAGLLGAGTNLGINLSNVEAVNAARAELGLEPMSFAEAAKAAILGNAGKVGTVEIDGKKVDVTLDSDKVGTSKKGLDTVDFSTAKAFDDAQKGLKDDDLDPAEVAQGFAQVNQGPMASSPAGGARAAAGIGTGWDSQPDITINTPTVETPSALSTTSTHTTDTGYEGKGLAALAPNEVTITNAATNTKTWDEGLQPEMKSALEGMSREMQGLTVNSGYRDDKHNEAVGGVRGSTHTKGTGADVSIKGYTTNQVANLVASARDMGLNKAIVYDNHIHFDFTGPKDGFSVSSRGGSKANVAAAREGVDRTLTPQTMDVPGVARDTAIAQLEAQNAPIAQGFLGSPEMASAKPGAQDLAQDVTLADLDPNIDPSRFGYEEGLAFSSGVPSDINSGVGDRLSVDPTNNVDPSRFGSVDPTSSIDPSRFGYGNEPLSPDIDTSRFGQIAQDPMLNETFDENRVAYSAPVTLSSEIYGQPEVSVTDTGRVDYATMSPAEAAANGMVDRSSQEKGMMSVALAGELSPQSLSILSNPENYTQNQVETAKAEAAGIISSMENTFASGKYADVESALTGRYDSVKSEANLNTSIANFTAYAPTLTGVVDSFYSTDKQGIVPVDYAVTHYYNPDISNPSWGAKMTNPMDIGDHRFGILDSQWDVPVSNEFQDKAIQMTLDSAPVPTPFSVDEIETTPEFSVDTGKGFIGSPELSGQMMNEPAFSEGMFSTGSFGTNFNADQNQETSVEGFMSTDTPDENVTTINAVDVSDTSPDENGVFGETTDNSESVSVSVDSDGGSIGDVGGVGDSSTSSEGSDPSDSGGSLGSIGDAVGDSFSGETSSSDSDDSDGGGGGW